MKQTQGFRQSWRWREQRTAIVTPISSTLKTKLQQREAMTWTCNMVLQDEFKFCGADMRVGASEDDRTGQRRYVDM
eukprot:3625837-Rhodomonas_salina.1